MVILEWMVPLRRHKVDLFVSCAYDIVICAGKHMVLALHSALARKEIDERLL
jgi:hypothetical protein